LPFQPLSCCFGELEELIEQHAARAAQVIDEISRARAESAKSTGFARGFSTEALVERFEPMVCDLAADVMVREKPRLTGLSNTQAKGHWNRATEAVVERMLALGGICQRLLGDEFGGLVFRHRHSFRSAMLKRLRDGWRFRGIGWNEMILRARHLWPAERPLCQAVAAEH
jgi:hypothetical protein